MILEMIGAVAQGVLGGGATGLLGVCIQRFFDHLKHRNDIELVRVNHDNAMALQRQELEFRERMAARSSEEREAVAAMDVQAREVEAAERSFVASYQHDTASYLDPAAQAFPPEVLRSSGWARFVLVLSTFITRLLMTVVDFARGMVRPGMTLYTNLLLLYLVLWLQALAERTGAQLTPAQQLELTMEVVQTITYLATTTTVWWFGVRTSQPKKK